MKNYYDFNVVAYLQDSLKWDAEIKKLQAKVEMISASGGIDYSKVGHSTAISDPVGQAVASRENPLREIAEINRHKKILADSRQALSKAENQAIDLFFYSKGKIPVLVDNFCYSHGYSRAGVYRLRRKALENLKQEIKDRI